MLLDLAYLSTFMKNNKFSSERELRLICHNIDEETNAGKFVIENDSQNNYRNYKRGRNVQVSSISKIVLAQCNKERQADLEKLLKKINSEMLKLVIINLYLTDKILHLIL